MICGVKLNTRYDGGRTAGLTFEVLDVLVGAVERLDDFGGARIEKDLMRMARAEMIRQAAAESTGSDHEHLLARHRVETRRRRRASFENRRVDQPWAHFQRLLDSQTLYKQHEMIMATMRRRTRPCEGT